VNRVNGKKGLGTGYWVFVVNTGLHPSLPIPITRLAKVISLSWNPDVCLPTPATGCPGKKAWVAIFQHNDFSEHIASPEQIPRIQTK